jgi:Uma2 family endonuclease
MTTEEYLKTPERLAPAELIYGVLRVADSPLVPHQTAVGDWFLALDAHLREHHVGRVFLSPLDIILDEPRALILQPDLMFVSNDRSHIVSDKLRGAPDMVLEVLSPHPRIGKLHERIEWFAQYDVRECWLVHQGEKRVEVVRFGGRRIVNRKSFDHLTAIESQVLPDFHRSLDSILRWT